MLVDSFSFTPDETAASVDSQAQLLVEAGWQLTRSGRQAAEPSATDRHEPSADEAAADEAEPAGR
jgi:hypothetical protein